MDLFRMRCYLASLQGGELPNPKSLLATASRPTKASLGRLGVFSVSSFHALVSITALNTGPGDGWLINSPSGTFLKVPSPLVTVTMSDKLSR